MNKNDKNLFNAYMRQKSDIHKLKCEVGFLIDILKILQKELNLKLEFEFDIDMKNDPYIFANSFSKISYIDYAKLSYVLERYGIKK